MRSHILASLVVALTLATLGCNETTPTTPPESGDAPAMPPEAAGEEAEETNEMFEDEPMVEDERDVDDGG